MVIWHQILASWTFAVFFASLDILDLNCSYSRCTFMVVLSSGRVCMSDWRSIPRWVIVVKMIDGAGLSEMLLTYPNSTRS
jgi:hypothetical protein